MTQATQPVKTIEWVETEQGGTCRIIDQTLLPTELNYIDINAADTMWEAIKMLRVRGAPAIGIAAAFGVYLGVRHSAAAAVADFVAEVEHIAAYLATSRPTAVNLFWALDRIKKLVAAETDAAIREQRLGINVQSQNANPQSLILNLKSKILAEAIFMIAEDNAVCRAIGQHTLAFINDGDGWLTHCNAGGLATAQWGTALAGFYMAAEQGKQVHVFADETRPLLQGARLTAWELQRAGIAVTLITDNMAAMVMSQGKVKGVIVGTDRVAANGDFANKIGTLGVSILAKEFGIPVYVAAPTSSIDMSLASGDLIPIEERKPDEVTHGFGRQTGPNGIGVFNPAFDVTPARYVTAFITEHGVAHAPFTESLPKVMGQNK